MSTTASSGRRADSPTRARVLSLHALTPESVSRKLGLLRLQPQQPEFHHREGQFLGLSFPNAPELGEAYFSIASAAGGEHAGVGDLSLLVRGVDAETDAAALPRVQALMALRAGDELLLSGPYGEAFLPLEGPVDLLMVATGTGVAPMRACLQHLARQDSGGRRLLFYGARCAEEAAFLDELSAMPTRVAEVHFAASRQSGSGMRYVHECLRLQADAVAEVLASPHAAVCICGLPAMERAIEEALGEICAARRRHWPALRAELQRRGALHIQTY